MIDSGPGSGFGFSKSMRAAIVAVLLLSAPLAYSFQSATAADREGVLHGRVTETKSDPPLPIKKALVVVRRAQEPGTGVYTDEKGAYRLRVEPGAYGVSVERDGFVTEPSAEPKTITVQAGQTIDDLDLQMVRTGSISGRVLDSDGEPMPRATVHLTSIRDKSGRTLQTVGTNDRGEYRIFQIAPGKYRVSATYQPYFEQREIKLQTPDGTAQETYATTFFPGTSDQKQAAVIEVGLGADQAGFDLQLQRLQAVRVRGQVSAAGAAPIAIAVGLQPIGSQPGTIRTALVRDPSGRFELDGVVPGKYFLTASTLEFNNGSGASGELAIEVGETDLEGIQLMLAPPQEVGGTIVVPDGRQLPAPFMVVLSRREQRNGQRGGIGRVEPDGSFKIPAVSPGVYDIGLGSTGPDDDLYVGSIHRGDEDILANGLHVGTASADPVQIVLRANGGTIETTVRTSKGDPLPDARVVIVPDAPRRGQMVLQGRCITDARGACSARGVAPGDYHVFAFAKEPGLDFRDPESTMPFEERAKAVSVAEGGHYSVELEAATDDQ